MKNFILSMFMVTLSLLFQIKAQVGINTPTPASTLDITAKNATNNTTKAKGFLIQRIDRQSSKYNWGVYVNRIVTGTQTGIADSIGTGINIFSVDGSILINEMHYSLHINSFL